MAKIIRRTWSSTGPLGRKVKHVAYGYTLMVHGRQERKVSSAWLADTDALEALAQRQREVGAGVLVRADRTLGELAEEYLAYKRDQKKRSLKDGARILRKALLPAFGVGLAARNLTAPAIAQYEKSRLAAKVQQGDRQVSAYTVANELGVLRHMLRLAKRWGYLDTVPEVVLPKAPKGRLRFLDAEEIGRLLVACQTSDWSGSGSISPARGFGSIGRRAASRAASRSIGPSTTSPRARTRSRPATGAVLPGRQRPAGESEPDGVRGGPHARRDYRLPVPRSAAHGRQPPGHARGVAQGRPGDPRARGPPDDEPLRPPGPRPSAGGGGAVGVADAGRRVST